MNLPAKALNRFIVTQITDDGVAVKSITPCYLCPTEHRSNRKGKKLEYGQQNPHNQIGQMHLYTYAGHQSHRAIFPRL